MYGDARQSILAQCGYYELSILINKSQNQSNESNLVGLQGTN